MLSSEVAMTDAEKESEERCKDMLNQLIAIVKKQTLEIEDLAESMKELAADLKAIVQPPGATAHAWPLPVPAPTATLVTAVDHAVAAAAPRAEAALAPESPTKCSTSGPDSNASDLQVVAEFDPETGVPTVAPALAEHSSAPSLKLFSTIKQDTLMPTRYSTICPDPSIGVPTSVRATAIPPTSSSTIATLEIGNTFITNTVLMKSTEGPMEREEHAVDTDHRDPTSGIGTVASTNCLRECPRLVAGDISVTNLIIVGSVTCIRGLQLKPPWPPSQGPGTVLELFHKLAGVQSWMKKFTNAEMDMLNSHELPGDPGDANLSNMDSRCFVIVKSWAKGKKTPLLILYEEASQAANDAVSSIRTVASFAYEEKVMDLYKKKCEGPLRTGIRTGIISGIGFGVSFFLLFGVYAASFYAGARLIKDEKTTFAKVFKVFLALAMAATGVSQSSALASDSSKAQSAISSIIAIVDSKSRIDPSKDAGVTAETLRGNIEFQPVSFRYPTRPDVEIFRDLCLTIHSGKTVAFVAESASGKSTAISLLQRFYDPDIGHMLLDGVDIQKLQLRWPVRQPKWGHIRDVHKAVKLCEPALIATDPSYISLGQNAEAHVYKAGSVCAAFLANIDVQSDKIVAFNGKAYKLPACSVSILHDCKNVVLNTAQINSQVTSSEMRYLGYSTQASDGSSIVPEFVLSSWSYAIEPVGITKENALTKPGLMEQINTTADATRNLSQQCLNALAKVVPGLLGGSTDLASSNMALLKMFGDFQKDTPEERNVHFGVREHGMGAICNGIALHSPGLIPCCATSFVFTDYMRATMRISTLCEAQVIYVMTHDSIGLGEDGPTHQPIEHLVSFCAMPNILMLRPADGNETARAYKIVVLNRKRPSVLALYRQKLPQLPGTSIEGVEKGGYIISDHSTSNKPDLIMMSIGSELEIAAKASHESDVSLQHTLLSITDEVYGVTVEPIYAVDSSAFPSYDEIKKSPNKALLWCGTRSSNLLRHLHKGFLPAVCHFPVSAYMFGKAIFCSDAAAEAACYGFTAGDPARFEAVMRERGIPMLLDLARCSRDSAQSEAAKAIAKLSVNAKVTKVVADMGGIAVFTNMEKSLNLLVAEEATGGLWNLSVREEHKVAIAVAGGIKALVDLIFRWPFGADGVIERAAGALANLAVDVKCGLEVERAGGIHALGTLSCSCKVEGVLEQAARALANLAAPWRRKMLCGYGVQGRLSMEDLLVPWDPGGNGDYSFVSAWRQAKIQGGRNVTDRPVVGLVCGPRAQEAKNRWEAPEYKGEKNGQKNDMEEQPGNQSPHSPLLLLPSSLLSDSQPPMLSRFRV